MTIKDIPLRVDSEFEKELREIQNGRIKLGKDTFPNVRTPRRLTAAIRRHRFWPEMKKDIMLDDLKEDRGNRKKK